jgi:hypothetical protein
MVIKKEKDKAPLTIKITVGLLLLYMLVGLVGVVWILTDPVNDLSDPESAVVKDALINSTSLGMPSIVTVVTVTILDIVGLGGLLFMRRWAFIILVALYVYYLIDTVVHIDKGFGPDFILFPLVIFFAYRHRNKLR